MKQDAFISYAHADKSSFVSELAFALRDRGATIFYDDYSLAPGDKLRESIDRGLDDARFAIVVLSDAFFANKWTAWELDGLVARQNASPDRVILPIWHDVTREEVAAHSELLADLVAISSARPMTEIVDEIMRRLRSQPRPAAVRSPRPWRVTVIAPAPLSEANSSFAFAGLSPLRSVYETEKREVLYDGPVPQSFGAIQSTLALRDNPREITILHLHLRKERGRYVFESRNGVDVERRSAKEVGEEVWHGRPTAVVLTGANHSDLAHEIQFQSSQGRRVGIPVFYTTRVLKPAALANTVDDIYRRLYGKAIAAGTDLEVANVKKTEPAFKHSPPGRGEPRVTWSVRAIYNRARHSRSRIHSATLADAYNMLRDSPGRAIQVHAPVGTGVSTAIRILRDYFIVDPVLDGRAVIIELRKFTRLDQILDLVGRHLNIAASSFVELITENDIVFCVDGCAQNSALFDELWQSIRAAGDHVRSRFVLGFEEQQKIEAVPFALPQTSLADMRQLLETEIGTRAAAYADALKEAAPRPSGVYELIALIASKHSPEEAAEALKSGKGLQQQIMEYALSLKNAAPILRVATVLGPYFPIEVLTRILTPEGLSSEAPRELTELIRLGVFKEADSSGSEGFRDRLDRRARYLDMTPGMMQQLHAGLDPQSVLSEPGFVEGLSHATSDWIHRHYPTARGDGRWLTSAVRAMVGGGATDVVVEVAEVLVALREEERESARERALRSTGTPEELRDLLEVLMDAIGPDTELHDRLTLFLAEARYKASNVRGATNDYERLLKQEPHRITVRIEALRALGQIHFRKADYQRALDYFVKAAEISSGHPTDLTLSQIEQARVHLRLGEPKLAGDALARAAESLDYEDRRTATLHLLERANLARLTSKFAEARQLYRQARARSGTLVAERATAVFWLAKLEETEGRQHGSDFETLSAELQNLLHENPGHEFLAALAAFLDTSGNDWDKRMLELRLRHNKRLDLLSELQFSGKNGAGFYVAAA